MKINKDSLKARANNLSKEFNIKQGVIYNRFFLQYEIGANKLKTPFKFGANKL